MSNYSVTTNFGAKDALVSGNPLKLILGAQLTTEFSNIATAISSKIDSGGAGAFTTLSASGLVSANLGLTVAGAAFTSRGIADNATSTALTLTAGAQIGAPTGGDQGAGTLNATGLFINGVAVASAGSAGGTTVKVKTADTTRASNTTVTADPDLTFAVTAGHRYYFQFFAYINAPSSGGLQVQTALTGTVTNPSFATLTGFLNVSAAPAGPASNLGAGGGNLVINTTVAQGNWVKVEGQINALTSGNLAFAWAQNTSNVTATNVGAGSYGVLTVLS